MKKVRSLPFRKKRRAELEFPAKFADMDHDEMLYGKGFSWWGFWLASGILFDLSAAGCAIAAKYHCGDEKTLGWIAIGCIVATAVCFGSAIYCDRPSETIADFLPKTGYQKRKETFTPLINAYKGSLVKGNFFAHNSLYN